MPLDHRRSRLPELLAPAGSPEALEAALLAGADAVYLGGSRFNARLNAHNFDKAELQEAVTHAHRLGGRVYLTLNTLVWDRELPDALEAAYEAASVGVDALIVADVGAAALIRRALPSLDLHASTQLSGHNASVGEVLAPFGFTRFVIARETSLSDLSAAVRNNPLEVEVFIHGALCVSHSGQCLFSSVVGGRSGNRGECAQPCRLPYGCATCKEAPKGKSPAPNRRSGATARPRREEESYPLSLKDLSLAAHVPALIEAGVSSLKIEGRMKSPGYVGGVTAIWRKLLDEGRPATPDELAALGDLFSRGGFTDGDQVEKINRGMMGIRSEADKERTAAAERAAVNAKHPPHLPLAMTFTAAAGKPVTLKAEAPLYRQGRGPRATVTVEGDVPAPAENAPLTAEAVKKQLERTGGTPYAAHTVDVHLEEGLMLPLSRLNALRREALEALDAARTAAMPNPAEGYAPLSPRDLIPDLSVEGRGVAEQAHNREARREARHPEARREARRSARFYRPEQITPTAAAHFDKLYLPLGRPHPKHVPLEKRGVILPPVIFDKEAEAVREALVTALSDGVRHLMVGNVGHLPLIRRVITDSGDSGVSASEVYLHGDFRLNVANTPAAARLLSLGLSDLLLSPELTLPRMRDVGAALEEASSAEAASGAGATGAGATGAIVYGRLPLMLLEKCAIREVYRDERPERVCREICGSNAAVLRDRMGKDFPILCEDSPAGRGHRNVVYNSLPLCMSDRPEDVARARLAEHHFLFSTESPAEVDAVISAHRTCRPLPAEVRRMLK